jgi:LacI family transcriptional regulator
MVKIKDVAKEAGVSAASVSRALTGNRKVSPKIKKAVLAAAKKLGYQTNFVARSLRSHSTRTIGMIVPRIANPYFIAAVQSVERCAQAQGYDLFICDSVADTEIEKQRIQALLARWVDGIVIIPCDEWRSADAALEALRQVPVIAVDREICGVEMDLICVDNHAGIVSVMEHLKNKSRDHLAFVGARKKTSTARERLNAYLNHMHNFSPSSADRVYLGDFTSEWGKKAAEKILSQRPLPDAVVCANDLIAIGVVGTLRACGINIPSDIAVTGFDDIELCRFVEPPITTVHQPLDVIGAEATQRLLSRVEGDVEYHTRIRIVPELIVRASSG